MGLGNENVPPSGLGSETAQAGSGPSGADSRQGMSDALHQLNELLREVQSGNKLVPVADNLAQALTLTVNTFNEVGIRQDGIEQTVTRVDMSIRDLVHGFDRLEERMQRQQDQQRDQIEMLTSAVIALGEHSEGLSGRLEGLERRLERLRVERRFGGPDHDGRVAELVERIGDLGNHIDRVGDEVVLLISELHFFTHPGDTFRRLVKYFFNRRPFSFFYGFDE